MKQFLSFVTKETRHILRDKRTMLILLVMPIVQILLFGFAISNDVKNVRTVVVTSAIDHETQTLVERLGANEYFHIIQTTHTPTEAERLIRQQQADIAIVFRSSAERQRSAATASFSKNKSGKVQIITDAADPNMAQMYANYATQILSQPTQAAQKPLPFALHTPLLYNPQMRSAYNFVPGIMGVILMLICAMMTSISIVREKERGTMEVLLVSPIQPLLIILAKAVPYLVLAFAILTTNLLLSKYVLCVPLAGSIGWIYVVSGIYILLALSLGLLISTIARTQLVALIASAMMLIMPCIMLSGMIYPIESMPPLLQYVTAVMPPRYYISALRKLLIMGVSVDKVLPEMAVLTLMTTVLLTAALLKFNKRLE